MSGPPLEWPEEDQHLIPIERRRFGPHFEKPCFNPDTIVCAARSCQQAYKCQWRRSSKAVAYSSRDYPL